ncbi:cation diffusion facilitator family transporter [bacterium 3DAC]|nr:cation diffusion facilitator family transporter [bacterium 3DAC]
MVLKGGVDMGHHHHHHHIDENTSTLPIALTVLTNLGITIAELIGGYLSGSVALTADAFHNLGDSITSLLVWIAKSVEKKGPDRRHTFGFKRAEVIASFVVSLLLFAAGLLILREIIERTLQGGFEIDPRILLPVAIIGLLGNIVGIALLWKQAKHSMSIKGALIHLISDALSSVLVVVEGILLYIGFENLWYLDLIIGAFIVYFLFSHAYEILKESMHILMEGVPEDADIDLIEKTIKEFKPNIKDIHDIRVYTLTGKEAFVEVHAVVPEDMTVKEVDMLRDKLRHTLHEAWNKDIHLTLQVEAENCHCREHEHHHHEHGIHKAMS